NRANAIRGPIVINGGTLPDQEPFLHNPFLLPGETNLPLADGTISATPSSTGIATITDPYAVHVSALNGQRPGFDPRMNSFPYTATFLNGNAAGQELDVASVSQDILSFANSTAFTVGGLTVNGSTVNAGTTPSSAAEFIGTPVQTGAQNELPGITWS